jgi:signal transduction histidine kinase
MDLAYLSDKLPKNRKALIERVSSMTTLLEATADSVRRLSWRLRPAILDDLGLEAAIEWEVHEFQQHSSLEVEVDLGIGELVLDTARATAVFRILQEGLTNVARHAEATNVKVTMRVSNRQLVLQVTDNGKGITKEEMASTDALGLIGMRERAGAFGGRVVVRRRKEGGTQVKLTLALSGTEVSEVP